MKTEMAELHEDKDGFLKRSDMTLRDYFAGQAAIGLCMSGSTYPASFIARISYQFADAMLEARK